MGYSVQYSTTNAMKEYDALDRYLRSITDLKTLDLINKVIRNVVRESKDPKYRKLRLSNKLINAKIAKVDGALDALFEMGWVQGEENGEEVLLLPENVKLKFTMVQKIEAAIDHREKESQQIPA